VKYLVKTRGDTHRIEAERIWIYDGTLMLINGDGSLYTSTILAAFGVGQWQSCVPVEEGE
jgi:hypothetical protein